jgi:dGTPase
LDRELKDFLYNNLYRHWRVMRMDLKARRFLSDLFEAYTISPVILPTSVQRRIEPQGLHRTVCDYIAGMTDRFALEEYNKLFNPKSTYLGLTLASQ